MSTLEDLLNVVIDESFMPETAEMGRLAKSEYEILKAELANKNTIIEQLQNALFVRDTQLKRLQAVEQAALKLEDAVDQAQKALEPLYTLENEHSPVIVARNILNSELWMFRKAKGGDS